MAAATTPPRRRRALLAGGAVAVVAALGVVVGAAAWPEGEPADAPEAADVGVSGAAMCGVADPARYTALDAATDAAPSVVRTLVPDVTTADGATPSQLAATDDAVVALTVTDESATVTRYARDGGAEQAAFTLDTPGGGASPRSLVALDDLVVLPGNEAGGTDVVAYEADGTEAWRTDLADLDRGGVAGVLPWTAGRDDAAFAVVLDDSEQVALLSADGSVDPDGPEIAAGLPSVLDDGSLVVRTEPRAGEIVMRRYTADGEAAGEFAGTAGSTGANGRAALMERPVAVVTAPDGGDLVWGPRTRLVETDEDGVWRRIVLSGAGHGPGAVSIADLSPMLRAGDDYYFLSATEDGTALSGVDTAGMRTVLEAPMTWDLATASSTDLLGYGAGLETAAAGDYFADGTTPVVTARFAGWWSQVADRFELRYRVTGDPTITDAGSTTGTADVPAGGTVDLDLPPTRPGAYEVHAELVERATGAVRTATCLRYAVGAPGDDLDPGSLSGSADWGGAGPVRGVELADRLGFGVHRVQLDLTRLIPDPAGTPSAAGLDLAALPGAEQGDPFAGLAAAASLAARTDVELYVQLGQGGEAERTAVDAGTWGAWVGVVVEALREGAPDLHTWSAWNEPNNTGFGDGADYARRVLAPFAAAVRAADPDAVVVDGNALNVVVDWYRQMLQAGACTDVDVLGIHPYTGFNRSWDEEGDQGPLGQIAALRDAVQEICGTALPMWDTESGWWVDGPANHWAQAQDVARSMLQMRTLGVEEWMYFYSEGGWGEGNFSWALIQADSFVAPGALAMTTVSGLLEGRPDPVAVDTSALPYVHAVRAGPADGGEDDLWAVWTDDLATTVSVTAAQAATGTRTDLYGASAGLELPAGEAVDLAVTGSPTYLRVPAGTALALGGGELLGPDVLAGGTVTASSSADGADPAVLVAPGGAQASPWAAGARTASGPDVAPWVSVELAQPAAIDRVVVASAGIRCCSSGLRTYAVSVQDEDGAWHEVARLDDVFGQRTTVARFDAVTATAVQIRVPSTEIRGVTVPDVAYGGQTGGLPPAWEPIQSTPTWPLQLLSVAAYGPDGAGGPAPQEPSPTAPTTSTAPTEGGTP